MKTIEDASRKNWLVLIRRPAGVFPPNGPEADMSETMSIWIPGRIRWAIWSQPRRTEHVWTIPPLPPFAGRPAMLKLALTNLPEQRGEVAPAGATGEIEIGCDGMEGERVILFVRDNGVRVRSAVCPQGSSASSRAAPGRRI